MSDLSKEHLYEGVKLLFECPKSKIHLKQPKLYTLMSLGFQYLLYLSTKTPGSYLIRLEESMLADKLMKRSKDESTRKFLAKLLTTRKLAYGQSTFYLDYFQPQSWQVTQTVPAHKWKAALVVKGTAAKTFLDIPMDEEVTTVSMNENNEEVRSIGVTSGVNPFDEKVYLMPLLDLPIRLVWIAFGLESPEEFDDVKFPFIPEREELMLGGVKIASELKNKIL